MKLHKLINSLDFKGTLVFAKIAGSHSHNTNVPESDIDAMGIYRADSDDILGLNTPKETITNSTNDITIHELGKFCRLLLKGNPGIIEMLFTERLCYETGYWTSLRRERKRFLSQKVVKQYLGYLNAQIHKLNIKTRLHTTGGEYNTKYAYHFIRLGREALSIAQGVEPAVWLEGLHRDFLMDIRNGKVPEREVKGMATEMISEIELLKPWPLPEEGDKEWLNNWLLNVRKDS